MTTNINSRQYVPFSEEHYKEQNYEMLSEEGEDQFEPIVPAVLPSSFRPERVVSKPDLKAEKKEKESKEPNTKIVKQLFPLDGPRTHEHIKDFSYLLTINTSGSPAQFIG